MRNKGQLYADNIKKSLENIAGSFTTMSNEVDKNIQKAYLA